MHAVCFLMFSMLVKPHNSFEFVNGGCFESCWNVNKTLDAIAAIYLGGEEFAIERRFGILFQYHYIYILFVLYEGVRLLMVRTKCFHGFGIFCVLGIMFLARVHMSQQSYDGVTIVIIIVVVVLLKIRHLSSYAWVSIKCAIDSLSTLPYWILGWADVLSGAKWGSTYACPCESVSELNIYATNTHTQNSSALCKLILNKATTSLSPRWRISWEAGNRIESNLATDFAASSFQIYAHWLRRLHTLDIVIAPVVTPIAVVFKSNTLRCVRISLPTTVFRRSSGGCQMQDIIVL